MPSAKGFEPANDLMVLRTLWCSLMYLPLLTIWAMMKALVIHHLRAVVVRHIVGCYHCCMFHVIAPIAEFACNLQQPSATTIVV